MGKHSLWMILGCTIPLLLILILPLFGITGNYTLLIFIVAMFACHLLMPMHGPHGEQNGIDQTAKIKKHGSN